MTVLQYCAEVNVRTITRLYGKIKTMITSSVKTHKINLKALYYLALARQDTSTEIPNIFLTSSHQQSIKMHIPVGLCYQSDYLFCAVF